MIDWDFVLESLKWSKYNYQEKAQQYLNSIEAYRETTFEPKITQFNETITAIRELKKILGVGGETAK